jgi:F1F0 ATPase subunit 2
MMGSSDIGNLDMYQWQPLLVILLAGVVLGLLFFGSLWLSTGKILHSRHPVAWMLGGFVVRMALAFSAFYWLTGAQWPGLLACLVGFMLARIAVIKLSTRWQAAVAMPVSTTAAATEEVTGHASKP